MRYQRLINIAAFDTPLSVNRELQLLQRLLPQTELQNLAPFNQAYIIITNNIEQALADNEFYQPQPVQKLLIQFANLYFGALNRYVQTGALPDHWQQASDHMWEDYRFISLLRGARAHICYDLPIALNSIDGIFAADYQKIGRIIAASDRAIVASLDEATMLGKSLQRWFGFMYCRPMMELIMHWRRFAWHQQQAAPGQEYLSDPA